MNLLTLNYFQAMHRLLVISDLGSTYDHHNSSTVEKLSLTLKTCEYVDKYLECLIFHQKTKSLQSRKSLKNLLRSLNSNSLLDSRKEHSETTHCIGFSFQTAFFSLFPCQILSIADFCCSNIIQNQSTSIKSS